jgi:hypothetical protein
VSLTLVVLFVPDGLVGSVRGLRERVVNRRAPGPAPA